MMLYKINCEFPVLFSRRLYTKSRELCSEGAFGKIVQTDFRIKQMENIAFGNIAYSLATDGRAFEAYRRHTCLPLKGRKTYY